MTHKFPAMNKGKLNNPTRRAMLPADKILQKTGMKKGEAVADIGCGIGYFTIPMAELTGREGRVYAVDIQPEMLEEVKASISEKKLQNIYPVLSEEYGLKIEDKSVTFAFICTVLHEIEDKEKFLKEARRILKPGGRIAIVEWIKKESEYGPPAGHRLEVHEVEAGLINAGFQNTAAFDFNEHFYIITADTAGSAK